MIISEPLKLPTHCEKAAINGGTTAPPDIPIIISPESSFALSGYNDTEYVGAEETDNRYDG